MSVGLPLDTPSVQPPAYKALCSSAVAALILGLLSALVLLDPILAAVPLAGGMLGLVATRAIARRRDELAGLGLARTGMALSAAFLAGGIAWHGWVYATEVPEGYRRISYDDLQPDPEVPHELIPPAARALDGERVFLKGYPLSGSRITGIKELVLVRDRGSCCFGGNPKITDQVEVKLLGSLQFDYRLRMLRIAGVFRVHPERPASGLAGALYTIEADQLR